MHRLMLFALCAISLMACDKKEDSEDERPDMVFTVDQFEYIHYPVITADPNTSEVYVIAWAVFPPQPGAKFYTVNFSSPNVSGWRISWASGEPVPAPGAPEPNVVPSYDNGLIGGTYHIAIWDGNCLGPVGGPCEVHGEMADNIEDGLRALGGEIEVRVQF